jgi:hypothetical protein
MIRALNGVFLIVGADTNDEMQQHEDRGAVVAVAVISYF